MGIYPTKGERLTYAIESSFGTDPGSGKDIRTEGSPTIADPFKGSIQPETVYANVHDSDKPLIIGEPVDDAVKVTVGLRQASSGTSFLTTVLKSGGMEESVATSGTTTTGTPTTTSVELDDPRGAVGRAHFMELSGGVYWPVLAAGYTGGDVLTPAMALVSAPASGNDVLQASTIFPGSPKEVSTTLSFNHITRARNGSHFVKATALGCALQSVGQLVFEMNTAPTLELSFRAGNVTHNETTLTALGDNDFNDIEARIPINCQSAWEFANADAAGGITRNVMTVYKGTFTFGWQTQSVPGFGDSDNCVNGIQGHIAIPDDGQKRYILELEVPFDTQFIDDWEGSNPAKHIAFMQPSNDADNLGFGLVMPKCTLIEKPSWNKDNPEHRMTLKYNCAPAGYAAYKADYSPAAQPWYLILPTA